ncbi:MAG TPA: hypothetical protein VMV37_14040 [Gammaproteobacteria bacterium]|nr:hypothetical protein [Gammaproteobacteria bacterium]
MPHVIEPATSARAKCRGCEQKIDKGDLRFGERQPNAFGEGEMTLWFHVACAAFKRPEPFLEIARASEVPAVTALIPTAENGLAHRRLPRVNGAERAKTGRAHCRSCREIIEAETWRIELTFFEEYRFAPSGFIHAACAAEYFETIDILDRVAHFSPDLGPGDLDELASALREKGAPG